MTEQKTGSIDVVGFGPGSAADMTLRAVEAIRSADLVVGYSTYIDILKTHFPDARYYATPMTREIERCAYAVDQALAGQRVAVVSSGDSGIYGMAGIVFEVAAQRAPGPDAPEIRVIPGITAAASAAALMGAPLMHDFAAISLSDLMTPLNLIYKRVDAAASADFVICLYNPKSKKRSGYLTEACRIAGRYRAGDTPCGIASHIGRPAEQWMLTNLNGLPDADVDMFSIVIIGNSQTRMLDNRMVTPRGYLAKYQPASD